MRYRRPHVLAGAAAVGVALALAAPAAPASAADTLVIDASAPIRPVTHVASGGLYALATASDPSPSLLPPLRLNQLTQPPPGVQQLGNGATTPTGDALKVAANVTNAGAQQYIRMPDIYPDFPYKWVSWDDWQSKMRTMIQARLGATGTTNIDGWEIWNEPDGTWDTQKAGPYLDGWTRSYRYIRSLDATTPIIGPGYSRYDHQWYVDFLTRAKADGTLPDVIVWHELGDFEWRNIQAHVNDYRAIERSLGISPRPISVNEYGSPSQVDTPSVAAHFIAAFERAGVDDAERAYWYESGTIGGLIWNNQPTGSYWAYKWYGEMAGNMVSVTPSGDFDGAASYDATRKVVTAVVGGVYGTNTVQVKGLSSFGTSARVTVNYTPNSGRKTNVAAPTQVSSTTVPITNGTASVSIANQDYLGAYEVVVTPAAGPVTSYQQTYEAENATVVNAQRLSATSASNGGYVGRIDGATDMRNDSFVDFSVNMPTAGAYTMAVRYANGGSATSTQGLACNGGSFSTISYPTTGGWGTFSRSVSVSVNLRAGYNVIRLAKGSPNFAGGSGYAELDSITLTR